MFLGEFEGGALVFEDGRRIEGKGSWHQFDGQVPHWNEGHTGCKYSIVVYRSMRSKDQLVRNVGGPHGQARRGDRAAATRGHSWP